MHGWAAALAVLTTLGAGAAIAQQAMPDLPVTGAEIPSDDAVEEFTAPDATNPVDMPQVDPATVADLRTRLRGLQGDLQALRAELRSQGAAGYKAVGGDTAIERMNAMEAELRRLTSTVQETKNRVEQSLKSSEAQADDLDFRLCQLEQGCDLAALTGPSPSDPPMTVQTGGAAMAVTNSAAVAPAADAERAAFDHANETLTRGEFVSAAQQFGDFVNQHADGPLAVEAMYLEGAALDAAGDPSGAGKAWLTAFAAAPTGPRAPDTLLGLARVSDAAKPGQGCPYLLELQSRFPSAPQAEEAANRIAENHCEAAVAPAAPAPAPADDPESVEGAEAEVPAN
ncbi:MAG: tol-pal system protein [Paracoccus denitrificans]|nr:MAG: tol-pal system protein [Paracoccus denitrificans]PZO85876.1 MAG: tol-pal system protein [Paracoccus denitrificans]